LGVVPEQVHEIAAVEDALGHGDGEHGVVGEPRQRMEQRLEVGQATFPS
jgi:hypothetical protein